MSSKPLPVTTTTPGSLGAQQRLQQARDDVGSDREILRQLVRAVADIQRQLRGGGRTYAEAASSPLTLAAAAPTVVPKTTKVSLPMSKGDDGFVEVVRRGGRRSGQAPAGREALAGSRTTTEAAPTRAARKNLKRRERRRRTQETAAVSLTCDEEGGYLEALRKANEAIQLKDIGIDGLPCRRGLNSAFIWQIRGKEARAKAGKVAEALRRAVPETRVAVPQRCSAIRLVGLQAAVTATSIRCALLEVRPGIDPNVIKISSMRLGRGRLRKVTVTAPTVMCVAALDRRRINVNFTSVRVLALKPRPLRCHRCLARRHVAVACPAPVARIGVCFVCGEPKCPICVEAGRLQADHRTGSWECPIVLPLRKEDVVSCLREHRVPPVVEELIVVRGKPGWLTIVFPR
ncbi:hypothetical protein M0804_013825 [Polistes exclamans]|nr:hypothetical protein M0804_013825 [Polistes exclamans]